MIVGKAGEYLVAYEFSKAGLAAFVNPDPASPFDVLVTNGDRFITIQVKTTARRYLKQRIRKRPGLSPYLDKQWIYSFGGQGVRYGEVDIIAYVSLEISKVVYEKGHSRPVKKKFGIKNFEKLAENSLLRVVEEIMCS